MRRYYLFATLVLSAVALDAPATKIISIKCPSIEAESRGDLRVVPMIELVAAPDNLDRKRISVVGVLKFEGDSLRIFATKEHAAIDEFSSSVGAELPQCMSEKDFHALQKLSGLFVRIDGTFNAKLKLGAGFDRGFIESVELVSQYSKQ